ncbi:MAG TPA: hypothetical protein VN132_15045 [Bdellovibrio sp.]|nr:hypothetical protein [Bdellovibrio sp.]
MSGLVFLTECSDFAEAQVVKSFLISQGFSPRVRDEQTRGVAPHFQNLLGNLIIEIPEHEFLAASQALEGLDNKRDLKIVSEEDLSDLSLTQGLAKKALVNSILGCIFIPVLCNLYSMILGWRVLAKERPLSILSRRRLLLAIVFNALGFYIWLIIGSKYLFGR